MQSSKQKKLIGEGQVKADINVTPLVDVCLVMLIIFMVVTPMLQEGIDVNLPETNDPAKMPEGATQVTIALKGDGNVYVGDNWIPKDQLTRAIGDLAASSTDRQIVIKGDRNLPYREIREVMRIVNEAGFSGAGLVAKKK